MKYDFETMHKRHHTDSNKCNELLKYGVKNEFVTAPEIVEAIKHELDTSIMSYVNSTSEYLETVYSWMKTRHGWDAKQQTRTRKC